MITIHQIHNAFSQVKSGSDFPQYVQDLFAIGVSYYENFVSDGQTIYYGMDNDILIDEPKYSKIEVNSKSSSEELKHAISIHQQGKTDYPTFCQQAADAGVEKWIANMEDLTVSYFDLAGNSLLVEAIPVPESK